MLRAAWIVSGMREYRVQWDGSNPDDARPALAVEPVQSGPREPALRRGAGREPEGPQMGEQVIVRDSQGGTWTARVGWDLRLGWVLVPQPAWGERGEPVPDEPVPDAEIAALS